MQFEVYYNRYLKYFDLLRDDYSTHTYTPFPGIITAAASVIFNL